MPTGFATPEEVIEIRNKGLTRKQAAKYFGVKYRTFYGFCQRHGIEFKNEQRGFATEEEVRHWVYDLGLTRAAIAELRKVTEYTVQVFCQEHDIGSTYHSETFTSKDSLRRDIEEGLTVKEIASKYEVDKTTVQRTLNKFELATKKQKVRRRLSSVRPWVRYSYLVEKIPLSALCAKYSLELKTAWLWIRDLRKYLINSVQRHRTLRQIRISQNRENFRSWLLSQAQERGRLLKTPELKNLLGLTQTSISKKIRDFELQDCIDASAYISSLELRVREVLKKENGWSYNTTEMGILREETGKLLNVDFYHSLRKLAVEVQGQYWHNDKNPNVVEKDKLKECWCRKTGTRLIRLYEKEFEEWHRLEHYLRYLEGQQDVRFARKGKIREIASIECSAFLDMHHLQGRRGSETKLGLFHTEAGRTEELTAVMTFGRPSSRTDKNEKECVELLRAAYKYRVIGGFSKMLRHYIRNHPETKRIVTYLDVDKFTGGSYLAAGFVKTGHYDGYYWMNLNTGDVRSRYQSQVRKLRLSEEDIRTENEIMSENGYVKILTGGSDKYELRI